MNSDSFITDRDALMCLDVLSNHPVFSAFSTDDVLELISNCTIHSYSPHEVIVREGELVDAVYFIIQGQCEVRNHIVNTAGEPIEQPIATLREEESIGLSEVGLFSATGNRTATIVSLSEVKTLCLSIKTFQRFLQNHPQADEVFTEQLAMLMRMHFIKSVAPFASISNQNIKHIAEQIEEKSFAPGMTLFEQGDLGSACYIIVNGKVELFTTSSDGNSKARAKLEENAIFGEAALIIDGARATTARTTEATTLLAMNKVLFKEITQQNVKAYEALMELQLKRCRPAKLNNIEVYVQKNADGVEITTLKNPALGQYVQLSEQSLFLWNMLDGELGIHEITIQFFLQFHAFNAEEIAAQILHLHNIGFVDLNPEKKFDTSLKNSQAISKVREKMEFQLVFENTDEWMTKMFQHMGAIFYTKPLLLLSALVAMSGLAAFVMHFHDALVLLEVTPQKWGLFLLALLLVLLSTPLYELARAFTTKYYGRKVHCFGLGWSGFAPFAYCDTSDMWLSPLYRTKK